MERRELQPDGIKVEFTALIDVVFLLLIFFMLIPLKEMEANLETRLSKKGKDPLPTEVIPPPKVVYTIDLSSETLEGEVLTRVSFNGQDMTRLSSPTPIRLSQLEREGGQAWSDFVLRQRKLDRFQSDPDLFPGWIALRGAIGKAIAGAPEGLKTPVIIRSGPGVPFKWVMAALNTGVSANLENLGFGAPGDEIWNREVL